MKSHKEVEEAVRKEQGESWSLGNEGEQGFEKGEASFSPRCHTIHPADSRGLFGKKTQRNIKAGRLPEFIKGNQGTGSLSTPKKNCLGVIWKLVVALVNLGRTPPYILPECTNGYLSGPSETTRRGWHYFAFWGLACLLVLFSVAYILLFWGHV